LKNADDDIVEINGAWENISENMKAAATKIVGYYEVEQIKMWYDAKCSIK
jgi:hypothetical protein